MAWPDVHPPAYRDPNPTMSPPKANSKKPFTEKMAARLNSSDGCIEVGAAMPSLLKSLMVA